MCSMFYERMYCKALELYNFFNKDLYLEEIPGVMKNSLASCNYVYEM